MTYENPVDVVKDIASTSSRLEKERIVNEAWDNECYAFFEAIMLTYDRLITFGIKKLPKLQNNDGFDEDDQPTFDEFKELAKKLELRQLTGNAALNAVDEFSDRCDVDTWNLFYAPILKKDLRAGISETTVNKVLKKIAKRDKRALSYIVDVFGVQLANPIQEEKHLVGKKMIDVKFDGARLTTVLDKDKGTVTMYTRNGKTNENFHELIADMHDLLKIIPDSIVLDGEVVAGSFQQLMKQINRKDDLDTSTTRYALFDILSLDDFIKKKSTKTQQERHQMLVDLQPILQKCSDERIYVLPKKIIDFDDPQGLKDFENFKLEILSSIAEDPDGIIEGVMIKDADAYYECKRNNNWLKFKPTISVTLKVVAIEEGTGKNANSFGNFMVEGEDVDPVVNELKKIYTSVGSGFKDDEREDIWNNPDDYLGRLVEVEADGFSQSENATDVWRLRFPRFKGMRDTLENKGEKI